MYIGYRYHTHICVYYYNKSVYDVHIHMRTGISYKYIYIYYILNIASNLNKHVGIYNPQLSTIEVCIIKYKVTNSAICVYDILKVMCCICNIL